MAINVAEYASASALVRAVEKRLRSAEVFDDQPAEEVGRYIGRQPSPGRPPGSAGQWYAAVYWNGGRGDDRSPQTWNVLHGVTVTLTARLGYAPRDRQGIRLTTASDVYDLACAIAGQNIVHGNYDLILEANRLIPGTADYLTANGGDPDDATVNGFLEPLVVGPFGPERPAPAGWVAESSAKDVFVVDIKFEMTRHLKPYE